MNAIVIGQKKQRSFVSEWVNTIFWAGAVAILFRSFLLEPFNIPSGSMIPTLQVGDHLFVSKWNFGYSRFSFPFGSWDVWNGRFFQFAKPKRGDIIVFRKPNDTIEYVKRLIGLPGDTIQMKAGRLYINGALVPRENPKRFIIANIPSGSRDGYAHNGLVIRGNKIYKGDAPVDFNYTIEYKDDRLCRQNIGECTVEEAIEYTETLPNGVKHRIVEISDTADFDNTPLLIVPPNYYFMMGDNRDRSADSRSQGLGFVPYDNFMGKVWFVFYSHNYYSPLLFAWDWMNKMRWERFGIMPGK